MQSWREMIEKSPTRISKLVAYNLAQATVAKDAKKLQKAIQTAKQKKKKGLLSSKYWKPIKTI